MGRAGRAVRIVCASWHSSVQQGGCGAQSRAVARTPCSRALAQPRAAACRAPRRLRAGERAMQQCALTSRRSFEAPLDFDHFDGRGPLVAISGQQHPAVRQQLLGAFLSCMHDVHRSLLLERNWKRAEAGTDGACWQAAGQASQGSSRRGIQRWAVKCHRLHRAHCKQRGLRVPPCAGVSPALVQVGNKSGSAAPTGER